MKSKKEEEEKGEEKEKLTQDGSSSRWLTHTEIQLQNSTSIKILGRNFDSINSRRVTVVINVETVDDITIWRWKGGAEECEPFL